MSNTLKNLIIALGIALVLGGGYIFFFRGAQDTADVPILTQDIEIETERVLRDIEELEDYELDSEILTSKKFTSLKDYTVEIADVKTGRTNPFDPVQ